MKINFSLSLKLTLVVVLISFAIVISISYINIKNQSDWEKEILKTTSKQAVYDFAKSHSLIKELDDNITYDKLNNTEELRSYLLDLMKNNESVLKISIFTPSENGLLTVNTSTDINSINNLADEYNYESYRTGITYYILEKNEPILTVISPINISGKIIGTQETVLTIKLHPETSGDEQIKAIIIVAFISILVLIFSLLYLLRRIIVKPILYLRENTQKIGKGDLKTKVEIDSRDELGDLASAFNQMAKDLGESRDKIEEYNRILEGLLKQKDEFIGQLGHDLKNPLTPLVGLLPIIVEQEKDPEIKEHLKIMNHNAQYMRDLIFKTLQLAKLRSSNIQFDIENINLTEEIKNAIESQKLILNQNNIAVDNRIMEDIFVQADKLRISELLKNLISNSVKYTAKSGGKITFGAIKDKDIVTVGIKDTGIGMNKEQQEHIFSEFYKADKFSNDMESTGLGLAICKRIVEKHGGNIWAESAGPGTGSVFYFTLKLSSKN